MLLKVMDRTNIYGFINAVGQFLDESTADECKKQYIKSVPHNIKLELSPLKFETDTRYYSSIIQYYDIDKAYDLADPIGYDFINKHHIKDRAVDNAWINLKNATSENHTDLKRNLDIKKDDRAQLWETACDIFESSDYKKFQKYHEYYKKLYF